MDPRPSAPSHKRTSRFPGKVLRRKPVSIRMRRQQYRAPGRLLRSARGRLRHFRGATLLAVAVTGLLLLLLSPIEAEVAQDMEDQTAPVAEAQDESTRAPADTGEAVARVNQILQSLYGALPRLIVAVAVLIAAWLLTRLVRLLLRSLLRRWDGIHALSAVVSVAIWFLGVGIAFTVLVGDIRALVGSIGLIGLALSWALQAPIESFTGWLLNSFKGYYRVGDRIAVGEVFGDVYRIDFLTTTVWEIGGPSREGFVHAEQPTGRLVSFPNNAILTGTIVNLTRDYPYVWDELTVEVANESDLRYTIGVLEGVGRALFGGSMDEAARRYKAILASEGLEGAVAEEPQVFISPSESWTNITIRYLVPARERRKWKSELTLLAAQEMNKPDHSGRIIPVYPRRQIQFIGPDGAPTAFDVLMKGGGDRS